MVLTSWLAKLTLLESPLFADGRERQKLYFCLIANAIGISVMLGFGGTLALRGRLLIPITEFVCSMLLLSARIYLLKTKKLLTACIIAGLVCVGFLWIHLFTGGTDSSDPLWYFVFPPVVLYLLGLRLGLIFTLIAAAPAIVILVLLLAGSEVGGYSAGFILRFLVSYVTETFLFSIVEF